MKKLTLIIGFVILNVSFLCAQKMLLKKITSITISNFHVYDYYKYSVDWKLDSVIRVTELGDTTRLTLFDNDSLKYEIQPNVTWTFDYYGDDSIVEFISSLPNSRTLYKVGVYYINSDFEIISKKAFDMAGNYLCTYYYTYQDGNCIEILNPDGLIETMDYSSYSNPYLNEKKYFRRTFPGSVSFLEYGDFLNSQYEFVVNSSLNNYPDIVDFYINNELFSTLEYEYFNLNNVTSIDEITEILEVNYFNLLGQKIEKPLKGFFIEKISTTKGTISNKKYAY